MGQLPAAKQLISGVAKDIWDWVIEKVEPHELIIVGLLAQSFAGGT